MTASAAPARSYTLAEKLECVERELRMRKQVYARAVAKGNMPKDQADRETELMAAIVDDYRDAVEAEQAGQGVAINVESGRRRRQ